VRRVASAAELKHAAEDILRLHIGGKPVVSLLLEQALDIIHEYYLAVALDRAARRPVLLFSPHGGVDVERDAGSSPHGMVRIPIDPLLGLRDFQVRSLVAAAGLSNGLRSSLERAVRVLWKLYLDCDATLVEINPLSVARVESDESDGHALLAVDAKVSLDDSARFRQKMHYGVSANDGDPEVRAREAGFSYVRLEGNVGVMGNGAGLVMALIDQLADAGGRAADFLDIGGGASRQRIEAALDVLLGDERLAVLLIVVFGGITRCDEVARGLLSALDGRELAPPVVVQLSGTNAALAADLLAEEAGPNVVTAPSLSEAVDRAAEIAAHSVSRGTRRLSADEPGVAPEVLQ